MMNRGQSAVAKAMEKTENGFQRVILRKHDPITKLREELAALNPAARERKMVIFSSPAVDVGRPDVRPVDQFPILPFKLLTFLPTSVGKKELGGQMV